MKLLETMAVKLLVTTAVKFLVSALDSSKIVLDETLDG